MGCSKNTPNRKAHRDTGLPKKIEKYKINNLTYYLKKVEKEEQMKLNLLKDGNNKDQRRNK